LMEQGAMTAAPNIHKGTKGSMVVMTPTHPDHQAMGRAPQGAGAMIGTRTERAIGWERPPTKTGVRKTHSTPGAQRTRSLTAKPVSARVITTTMPSSQRCDTTRGQRGHTHNDHHTTPHKNTTNNSKSYPHGGSNVQPLPHQLAILHTRD
jgi:hypothetical protein